MNINIANSSGQRAYSQKELDSIINVCDNNTEIDNTQAKKMIRKMASIIRTIISLSNNPQTGSQKSQTAQDNTRTGQSTVLASSSVSEDRIGDVSTTKSLEGSSEDLVNINAKAKLPQNVEKNEDAKTTNSENQLDYIVSKIATEVGKKINTMRLDLGKVVSRLQQNHKSLENKLQKVLQTVKTPQISDTNKETCQGNFSEAQDIKDLIGVDYVRARQWVWINQFNSNIQHLHITDHTITAKSPAAVFGAKSLSENQCFKVFLKRGREVSIGVALQKFRSLGHKVHKIITQQFGDHFTDNLCIDLTNHGVCWNGVMNQKLVRGFEDGDVISVEVSLQDCTLTWLVNGQVLHKIRNQALRSKTWVPYISLSKVDSIRIVDN